MLEEKEFYNELWISINNWITENSNIEDDEYYQIKENLR